MRLAGRIEPGSGSGASTGQFGPTADFFVAPDAALFGGTDFFLPVVLLLFCARSTVVWTAGVATDIITTPAARWAISRNRLCMTGCITTSRPASSPHPFVSLLSPNSAH